MSEEWIRWEPVSGLAGQYYIDAIFDEIKGFKIVLSEVDGKHKIIMTFENSVHVYKRADETYRYKLFLDLDEKYGGDFYANWAFYRVNNSSFLKWISEQSCTISDDRNLIHFSILAENIVLDIANPSGPKVEIIKFP